MYYSQRYPIQTLFSLNAINKHRPIEIMCKFSFLDTEARGNVDIGRSMQGQKVWGSISSAAHVYKWVKFVFHTVFVHPAVMGTWCTDPGLDQ